MKTCYPILFVSFVLMSCSSVFNYCDSRTGKLEKRNVPSWLDAAFMDSVNEDIKSELKYKEFLNDTNWHDFWIHRCESLYYDPHLGDPYIQYVVDKRREVGLPDIPEIVNRHFRSQWRIFTDNVDKELTRESNGLPPPTIVYQQTWVRTWMDYWTVTEEMAIRNSAISTNGVEYINNQRKQMGLKPLQ